MITVQINNEFIEKVLSEFAILQTELKAHRDYLEMLLDICPAELMKVYDVPPLEESALQAVLKNDRQHQVSLYLIKTVKGFIESLPADEKALAEMRYLQSKTWDCIAEHLHVSTPTAKKMRVKVLEMGISFFKENPCPELPTVKRGLMESIQCPRL